MPVSALAGFGAIGSKAADRHEESGKPSPRSSQDGTQADRFAAHGGALDTARQLYSHAPKPWIDLSTGINPWPYPVPALRPEVWSRLPEDAAFAALEAEAARLYRCPPLIRPVAVPGTQAIIQRLPAMLGGSDIRILGVTYGEFARAFSGCRVRQVDDVDELVGADVAIVVNPNNPDGRLVAPEILSALAPAVGALVIDEAFMDALAPSSSIVPMVNDDRIVVLRSFGKFYGLAGLRLGFALVASKMATLLRSALGPWSVSGPALAIGSIALADHEWIDASRTRLVVEAAQLDETLVQGGFTILGGTPLFRLARHQHAPALFEALAEAGLLTRPFADAPDRLRFGLPGSAQALRRLKQAIAK